MKLTITKVDNGYIMIEDWQAKDSPIKTYVVSESEWEENSEVRAVRDLLFMIVDSIDPNIRVEIKIKNSKHSKWAKLD